MYNRTDSGTMEDCILSKGDHSYAAQAQECALFGKPEPGIRWRTSIPTMDWKMARGPGSPNINKMAATANLVYSDKGRERDQAVDRMLEFYHIHKKLWMLAEPETWIYGAWHMNSDAACVEISRRLGVEELERAAMWVLMEHAERSALMSATLRNDKLAPNHEANQDKQKKLQQALKQQVGHRVVVRAGCRSWGLSGYGTQNGFQDIHRVVLDGVPLETKGSPGDIDGYNHTGRVMKRCLPIYKEAFRDAGNMSVQELLSASSHWSPARVAFQYMGWESGDRLCLMGKDEDAFVDEDLNSNTPGVLGFGIIFGSVIQLPEWPAPNTGKDHIRQKNLKGDVDVMRHPDGTPYRVELLHDTIGRKRTAANLYLTHLDLPVNRPQFWIRCMTGGSWENAFGATVPPVIPPSTPPTTPTPTTPKKEKKWWEKFDLTEI